jgi:SAM-dependent methyltransferase
VSRLIWHEVECGCYAADLPLWEELADGVDGPIMELGCGAGRVTLHLARRGAPLVIGLDRDPELVKAVWEGSRGGGGDAEVEDVRNFSRLGTEFDLVLAPMQVIQLLGGSEDRLACLSCVVECMSVGALAAFAIVEQPPLPSLGGAPPLPDVRQVEGWIYSSLPLETVAGPDSMIVRRLRQTIDPEGKMSEEVDELELELLEAETLEAEARQVGLLPAGRREIPATEAHVGSTVVLLQRRS